MLQQQNKTQTQARAVRLGGRAAPLGDLLPWERPLGPPASPRAGRTFWGGGKVSAQPGCGAQWWLVAFAGDALGRAARTAALLSWGAVVRNCSFFEAFWLGWALFSYFFTPDTEGALFVRSHCLEETL